MTELRTKAVSYFACLTDKCEDTCCKHWSMQINAAALDNYKQNAPELLDAVESDGSDGFIMRKDVSSGYCVKFEDGKCGIQNKYGEDYLGDACYFYPRITRLLGDLQVVTATMSCPEIARISFFTENPFILEEAEFIRRPQDVRNILPEGLSSHDAVTIHSAFIKATEDEDASAERIFTRIASVSRSLQRIEKKDWLRVVPLYLRLADSSLPVPERNINDPFNLLHSLCGLIVASKKQTLPRLKQTILEMEQALQVRLDWQNVLINTQEGSLGAYNAVKEKWDDEGSMIYAPVLKKWLAAQFSAAFYPFAGLGESLKDKITIIGVRFAIFRLALMSLYSINNGQLHQDDVVRVAQSLSRFLEHLADPSFSIKIYEEVGWDRENRMLGLLS